jgi:glutathione S-transferase
VSTTARSIEVAASTLASALRLGAGRRAHPAARQPVQRLELYEFEACPFCRLVREALSELDFDAMVYPCPRGGTRFRPKAAAIAGREQFPLLVDPNTGRHLLESADIVRYLRETYGGPPGASARPSPLSLFSARVATVARRGHGLAARSDHRPAPVEPLELWSFEACPFCRLVREALCELEIPYVLHNVAPGSAHRQALVERSGRMMVPYLVDPNTGQSLFESADIVRYLEATYGPPRPSA